MPHPLDALLCEIRDLTDALKAWVGAGPAGSAAAAPARAQVATTSQRQFRARPAGRRVSANELRAGLLRHNASDGTLLVAAGDEEASVSHYMWVVGPGETWDTRAVPEAKHVRKALKYAWVTPDTDLGGYPAGVFARATGGALKVTELSFQ